MGQESSSYQNMRLPLYRFCLVCMINFYKSQEGRPRDAETSEVPSEVKW